MSRPPARRWVFYAIAGGVFAAVLALAALSFASMASLGRLALQSSERRLLSDAMLLARAMDGSLRLSEAVLDEAGAKARSGSSLQSALAFAALALPEADNVYYLDRDFDVVAAASAREAPLLRASPGMLGRAGLSPGGAVFLADAPAEGGPCLVSLRPAAGGASFAALFRSSLLGVRLSLLMDPAIGKVELVDAEGLSLELLAPKVERSGRASLAASFALSNYPLQVRVEADRETMLGPSAQRTRAFMPLALVSAAAALLLFAYALRLERRAAMADRLDQELAAKVLLLGEVNHRVKNNLSVAGSIIGLGESAVLDAPDEEKALMAAEVLRDARDKILSMSMLHEQLYKHSSFAAVDLGAYLADLARLLAESYASRSIGIEAEAEEGLVLGINSALPVALIVTELVTNASKHAFPSQRGRIRIRAAAGEGGGIEIEVLDDGVGMACAAERGFGSLLVEHLAAQVGARLEAGGASGGGSRWRLSLPPEALGPGREGA
ncbi:MAG TPA: sensor histidine kinase [Spirochaetales bacterium]|nr:sensor histidine kinase [Spirochaetales bacterium]HRY53699.1 sensor histidine kinase [Spirochaetia bacterium]HRZ65611.1 sensor histidine kinase [Spirochaetia bacterium]